MCVPVHTLPKANHARGAERRDGVCIRTFLKVYMELGSYFLFLQEQIKDIIIIGGRLVFATSSGFEMPRRPAGTACTHTFEVVHGVTAMESGTRYSLFFCNTKSQYQRRRLERRAAPRWRAWRKLRIFSIWWDPPWRNSSTSRQPFCCCKALATRNSRRPSPSMPAS